MSTGSAHLYHTTHPSSAGEVQHCFPSELSATLPLRCLPTWGYCEPDTPQYFTTHVQFYARLYIIITSFGNHFLLLKF